MKTLKKLIAGISCAAFLFGMIPGFDMPAAFAGEGEPTVVVFEVVSTGEFGQNQLGIFFNPLDEGANGYTYTHDQSGAVIGDESAPLPNPDLLTDISAMADMPAGSLYLLTMPDVEANYFSDALGDPLQVTLSIGGKVGGANLNVGQFEDVFGGPPPPIATATWDVGDIILAEDAPGADPNVYGTYTNGGTFDGEDYFTYNDNFFIYWKVDMWAVATALGGGEIMSGQGSGPGDPTGSFYLSDPGGEPEPQPVFAIGAAEIRMYQNPDTSLSPRLVRYFFQNGTVYDGSGAENSNNYALQYGESPPWGQSVESVTLPQNCTQDATNYGCVDVLYDRSVLHQGGRFYPSVRGAFISNTGNTETLVQDISDPNTNSMASGLGLKPLFIHPWYMSGVCDGAAVELLDLYFGESLDPTSATVAANYALTYDGGAPVVPQTAQNLGPSMVRLTLGAGLGICSDETPVLSLNINGVQNQAQNQTITNQDYLFNNTRWYQDDVSNISWDFGWVPPPPASYTVQITQGAATSGGEGGLYDAFTVTSDVLVTGSDLTVFLNTSGSATGGVDYTPAAMAVIPAGQTEVTVQIQTLADEDLEPPETVILTISSSETYSIGDNSQASFTINDDEVPAEPVITINTTPVTIQEYNDATPTNITVTSSTPVVGDLAVSYTLSGTATTVDDYQSLSGTVTIQSGQTTANIVVLPVDDATAEGPETLIITIQDEATYAVGANNVATARIADDDAPAIKVTQSNSPAGEGSTMNATLSFVFLVPEAGVDYTVAYELSGTATQAVDYTFSPSSPVTLNSVTPTGQIDFDTNEDASAEGDETIIVTVAEGEGYTVPSDGVQTTTLTITNVAPPPQVTIAATSPANEDGTVGQFTVTSSAPAGGGGLTVDYLVGVQSTATAGVDYEALSGSVVVAEGQTTETIAITPITDELIEGDELIEVIIVPGAGYTAGNPNNVAIMTMGDDDVPESIAIKWMLPNPQNNYVLEAAESPIGIEQKIRSNYPLTVTIDGQATNCTGDNYTLTATYAGTGQSVLTEATADPGVTLNSLNTMISGSPGAGTYTVQATCVSSEVTSNVLTATLLAPCVGDLCLDTAVDGGNTTGIIPSLLNAGNNPIIVSLEDPGGEATMFIKRNTSFTVNESWNGLSNITFAETPGTPLSSVFDSFISEGVEVQINSSIGRSVNLSVPAVIMLRSPNFKNYTELKVMANRGNLDSGLYRVEACGANYIGGMAQVDLVNPTNYTNIAAGSSCYLDVSAAADYVAIATKHFSSFVVGESTGDDIGSLSIMGYGPEDGSTINIWDPIDLFFDQDPDPEKNLFPLTNASDSIVSIMNTDLGTPVLGKWESFKEGWGDGVSETTFYRVTFFPQEEQGDPTGLPGNSDFTVGVSQTFAGSADFFEDDVVHVLNEGFAGAFEFSFSTGDAGFTFGDEFGSDQGGDFPPSAYLAYPDPWSNSPATSNTQVISVGFDRMNMDVSSFNGNITLHRVTNGVAGPALPATIGPNYQLTPTSEHAYVTPTDKLVAGWEYMVKVTKNVKDANGKYLAGMPVTEDGDYLATFGFGYENMGPWKQNFIVSSSANPEVSTAGTNIDQYDVDGDIVEVPVSKKIKLYYTGQLNPTSVTTSSVYFISDPGMATVRYNPNERAIVLSQMSLAADTEYTITVTGVKDNEGNTLNDRTLTFTTGGADATDPQVVFAEADNYGFMIHFNEPLNYDKATDINNFTFKTCSQQGFTDINTCADASAPTVRSKFGKVLHYEEQGGGAVIRAEGFTLTPGDGFFILASGVADAAGNTTDTSANSWDGTVFNANIYEGGQGMFNMGTMKDSDIDWATEWKQPTNVHPSNLKTGKSTTWYIDLPFSAALLQNSTIEIKFTGASDVSGAILDPNSPINSGKFASSDPTGTGITAGGAANDGVAVRAATNTVILKLGRATLENEFFMFDLAGITTSLETGTYNATVTTKDPSGNPVQVLTANSYDLVAGGNFTITGSVKDESDNTGISDVNIFLETPTGFEETTTNISGVYTFANMQTGQYHIGMDPYIETGGNEYQGQDYMEPLMVTQNTTKNFLISKASADNAATLNVRILAEDLGAITSLGFDDSIEVFVGSQSGFSVKTLTRSQLANHIADPIANPIQFYINQPGGAFVGVNPAMPKTVLTFQKSDFTWMSSPPQDIFITQEQVNGDQQTNTSTFELVAKDKSLTVNVVDASGNPVPNAEVFAHSSMENIGSNAKADLNGQATLSLVEGTFKVGAFLPGMPPSKEKTIKVMSNGDVLVGTSTTPAASLTLKISSEGLLVISGKVFDSSGNPIQYAPVWAYKESGGWGDSFSSTDSTGKYTLYVSAGTWKVEADAPGIGWLGQKSITITNASSTGNNFTASSDLLTLSGSVTGLTSNGNVNVWAWGPSGGGGTMTDSSGNYTISLPSGTYEIGAYKDGIGDIANLSNVSITSNTTQNFSVATPRTVNISVNSGGNPANLSEGVSINFNKTNSPTSRNLFIPAGTSTATGQIPDGQYYLDYWIPGIPYEAVTVTGASFSDGIVTIDGTENITITIPVLRTVTGNVRDSEGAPLIGAWVSVFNPTNKQHFGVSTNTAGGYTIKVPAAQGLKLSADAFGYGSQEYTLASSGNVIQDITATSYENLVTGTVRNGSSVAIGGAHIWAQGANGEFAWADTDPDGTYDLFLGDGIWTLKTTAPGYAESSPLTVDTTGVLTGKNLTLSSTVAVNSPKSQSINATNGGTIADANMNLNITIPGKALSQNNESMQVTASDNNAVSATNSTQPVGNGFDITVYDSNNTPVTNFGSQITIKKTVTLAELTAADATTYTDMDAMALGYFDVTTGKYIGESTTKIAKDASGSTIPVTTLQAAATLTAAGVATLELSAQVNHATTFAPIVPTGDTPPATPSGLSAVAGDTTVTLTWTANSEGDMDYYNIWEANVTEGVLSTLSHASCTATCSATITGLTNDTAYSFQILAVDTGANSSAGSSSVSVTPVAEPTGEVVTPTPSGQGVVLPSGGSGRSTKQKKEEETISKFILETAKDIVDISEIGVIAEATTVISEDEIVKVTFEENTTILDGAADLTQGIPAPEIVEGITTAAPAGATLIGEIYEIGLTETGLVFSKPVTLRMAVPAGYDTDDNLKIYYLDEKNDEWVMAEDGGDFIEIDGENYIEVGVYHLTKFTIMEVLEEVAQEDEEETPEAPEVVDVDASIFEDVTTHWAREYIEKLYESGIVSGITVDTFEPDAPITRAEVAKISVKGFELDLLIGNIPSFKDVSKSDWYAPYVVTAEDKKIVNGYSDGTFKPNNPVSRAEALKMFIVGSGLDLNEVASMPFSDIDASAWYAPYIVTAYNLGIVSGIDEDTFAPDQPVSRAEASKMLDKIIKFKNLRDLLLKWRF